MFTFAQLNFLSVDSSSFASNDQGQPYGGDVGSSYPEELHHRVSRGRDCLKSHAFSCQTEEGFRCASSDLLLNYEVCSNTFKCLKWNFCNHYRHLWMLY